MPIEFPYHVKCGICNFPMVQKEKYGPLAPETFFIIVKNDYTARISLSPCVAQPDDLLYIEMYKGEVISAFPGRALAAKAIVPDQVPKALDELDKM